MIPVRFTMEDAERASDAWGANCGPGAIAAIVGLSLDELRPHMGDFEQRRFTNPTLMWQTLGRLGAKWRLNRPAGIWPAWGLARIQWEGPWMKPGVPIGARYQRTHWVGSCSRDNGAEVLVFDINAIGAGGWISVSEWAGRLVPWLVANSPNLKRADGRWHITHSIEIDPATVRSQQEAVA